MKCNFSSFHCSSKWVCRVLCHCPGTIRGDSKNALCAYAEILCWIHLKAAEGYRLAMGCSCRLWEFEAGSVGVLCFIWVYSSRLCCLPTCKSYYKGAALRIVWLPSKGNEILYAVPKILTRGGSGKYIILPNFWYLLLDIFGSWKKKFFEVLTKAWRTTLKSEKKNSTVGGGGIIYWFTKTRLTAVSPAFRAKSIPSAQSSRQLLFMKQQKKKIISSLALEIIKSCFNTLNSSLLILRACTPPQFKLKLGLQSIRSIIHVF